MTPIDRGNRVHFAAELRQIAKDVEAGTVSLEHAASLLLVVSVRMEKAHGERADIEIDPPAFSFATFGEAEANDDGEGSPFVEPEEQCGQCGTVILGYHACSD
jgi:hypothetical protein